MGNPKDQGDTGPRQIGIMKTAGDAFEGQAKCKSQMSRVPAHFTCRLLVLGPSKGANQ